MRQPKPDNALIATRVHAITPDFSAHHNEEPYLRILRVAKFKAEAVRRTRT